MASSDIDGVRSYVAPSDVSSNSGRKEPRRKELNFLSFQFAKFFCGKVRVPMSKEMDKRSYADVLFGGRYPSMLNFAVPIVFSFAAAYQCSS